MKSKYTGDALRTLRLLSDQVKMAVQLIEDSPPMIRDHEDALRSLAEPQSGFFIGQFQIRDVGCRGDMKPMAPSKTELEKCVDYLSELWGRPLTLHEAIAVQQGLDFSQSQK